MVNNCNGEITSEASSNDSTIKNWYSKPEFGLEITKIKNSELFEMPNIKGNPDFRMKLNNIAASGK